MNFVSKASTITIRGPRKQRNRNIRIDFIGKCVYEMTLLRWVEVISVWAFLISQFIFRNKISSDINYTGHHRRPSHFGHHKILTPISSRGIHWPNRTVNTSMANGVRWDQMHCKSCLIQSSYDWTENSLQSFKHHLNLTNRKFIFK